MKKWFSIFLVFLFVLCIVGCEGTESPATGGEAAATSFPAGKTIKIICPYSAGGTTDLLARALGAKIGEILGCPVVVEDLPGGGGAVGMNACKSAKADGYTIIQTSGGACTLTPQHNDVGYTIDDFVSVCRTASIPNVLYVNADSGIKSLQELFEYCKANPGTTVGVSTYGLSQHMTMEGLAMQLNMPGLFNIVNFDGGADVVASVLGGQIIAGMNVQSEVASHIQAGTFIGLATTNAEPTDVLPDVPSFVSQGLDVNDLVWYNMAAPAGTPEEIIKILDDAFAQALSDPEIIKQMDNIGMPIAYLNHVEMDNLWRTDWDRNGEIIKALKAGN